MSKDFTHLHVHTDASALDGINKCDALCKHVKQNKMSACAVTDHGNMHAAIDFYKRAKENNINPLIGVEAYITSNEDHSEEKQRDNNHCILIAMNNKGLQNLFWLSSQAALHNFYYKPRISLSNLMTHNEGLIATTSCLGGIVAKQGLFNPETKQFSDPEGKALKRLETFASIFNDRLYVEIQDNPEFWEQESYNNWLIQKAKDTKLPLVITSDAHYLTAQDKATHDLIMAQQLKIPLHEYQADDDGLKYGAGHYIRTAEEMYQAAIKYGAESSFWNTTELSKRCSIDIELGKWKTPKFDPSKEKDYKEFKAWKAKRNECSPH